VINLPTSDSLSLADVLLDPKRHPFGSCLAYANQWGFTLAPSEIALASKERSRWPADEFTLRDGLAGVTNDYDIVLIDCPPSLGVLTLNALTAAQRLLVVTQPSFLALQGLADLLETHELVRQYYNPALTLAGVIVNNVGRTSEHADRVREIQHYFGRDLVWEPAIPKRTVVEEAAGKRVPIASLGAYKEADRVTYLFTRLARHIDAIVRDEGGGEAPAGGGHQLDGDAPPEPPALDDHPAPDSPELGQAEDDAARPAASANTGELLPATPDGAGIDPTIEDRRTQSSTHPRARRRVPWLAR
jgi:chromosome partitioning protein